MTLSFISSTASATWGLARWGDDLGSPLQVYTVMQNTVCDLKQEFCQFLLLLTFSAVLYIILWDPKYLSPLPHREVPLH